MKKISKFQVGFWYGLGFGYDIINVNYGKVNFKTTTIYFLCFSFGKCTKNELNNKQRVRLKTTDNNDKSE